MNALKLTSVLAALAVLPAFGEDLVLKSGDVEIVADAPKDAFAVGELKSLLGEAFGTEIPVVFAPSGTRKTIALEIAPSFARDDIRLVTDANGVRIINGASRTNGIYEFLERYAGMRFYFPGPLGTIVPKRTELVVPFGTVDVKPCFTQRSCDMNWSINGRWYSLAGEGEADKVEAGRLKGLAYARMRLAPRLMCCHGLSTGFHLLERFGETHPEYFALLETPQGERFRDNSVHSKWGGHHGQLCHTSGVWEEIYNETARRLRAGETTVDVMAQDGMQKCLCERCLAAYSKDPDDVQYATELMWGNTVRIANRLTENGIGGYVTQMSYQPYARIPEIAIPSNVLVMVAACGPWAVARPEALGKEQERIRSWSRKLGHPVWIWNYACKTGRARMRNVDIPQMAPRAVGAYYKALADDIFGSYFESRTDRWIYNYLNYYVYNKVCWDTKVDVDALLDEHYRLMFGAAAGEMKAWYERLEDIWLTRVAGNVVETDLGPEVREPTEYQKWVDIFTPAVLAEFDGYIARALARVPAGSLEAQRVAFFRRHFQEPLRTAAETFRDKIDAVRNAIRREGRENRSVLKGTRFDAPEEFVFDGETPRYRFYSQPLNGLLKPNTKYLVSYFVKQTNVVSTGYGGGACIRLSDGNKGSRLFPQPECRVGSRDWLYYEYEQKTGPKLGEKPFLRIGVEGATGKAWFKGVRVEEVK